MILAPSEILQPGIILRAVYDTDKYRQEVFSAFFSEIISTPHGLEEVVFTDNLETDL